MKKFVGEGKTLNLVAPHDVAAGGGALVGDIFGVAENGVANGVAGEFKVVGVFDIAKATGAVTQGAPMYWDVAAKVVTTVAAGNRLVGTATQAQQSGDATARVALHIKAIPDPVESVLTATAALDFPSLNTLVGADLTITVTGAAVGDAVALGPPAAPEAGLTYTAFVSAANTVTVRCSNVSGGTINPASATFRVTVFKA